MHRHGKKRLNQIYIPLCFYYIEVMIRVELELLRNLHSTMFLLHLGQLVRSVRLVRYLHSTMFLLHPNLYISNVDLNLQFTFHYVSITSSEHIKQCITTCIIYIPLCFYYIWSQNLFKLINHGIYIPLCFYYILTLRRSMSVFW